MISIEDEEDVDTIDTKENIDWISHVNVYIIPIAAGILVMLLGIYLMLNIQHFTNDCNAHWQQEMKTCGCLMDPENMTTPDVDIGYAFEKNSLIGIT